MKPFIRAMDVRAWISILTRWTPPTATNSEGKKVLKPEIDWSNDDDRLANYNNKALNTIFNGCKADHIKLISSCGIAKEAWEILQTTFKGSGDVKNNKLLSFTTYFENLGMHDDESLSDFYIKFCNIANKIFCAW